ncbi:MAG: hypothetical protein OCD00_08770 [Colwellia sp.]
MEFNVSNYSVDELFQSLEAIDDIQQPKRALIILKELLTKSGLTSTQVLESFENGSVMDLIGTLPLVSIIASDVVNTNSEVTEKLNRLLVQL